MIKGDKVYGKPLVQYTNTKANIEAMTGLAEGSTAYATDTNQLGTYDGSSWTWGQGETPVGKYSQLLYAYVINDFAFIKVEGQAVSIMIPLE